MADTKKPETLEEALEVIAQHEQTIANSKKDVDDALQMNEDLQNKLTALEKKPGKKVLPSCEYEKETYDFTLAKFYVPGFGAVTAEAAATNQKLIKKLIDVKSKVLTKRESK